MKKEKFKLKISYLAWGISFVVSFSQAQNLVPDSSFENNKGIPTDFSGIGNSNYWSRPGMGTTDLFAIAPRKKKGFTTVGIPQNAMGYQFSHSGSCYAGFFLFSHGDYREYLQTPLTAPLEKGKTYFFSMYISLADYSRTYIDKIGFCFLPQEAHYETADVWEDKSPRYITLNHVGNDTAQWHHLTTAYIANGNEKFLIVGSFNVSKIKRTRFSFPKKMKSPINKTTERDAYYFVDDISLREWINPPEIIEPNDTIGKIKSDTIKAGATLILKNVLFESNSAQLMTASYSALDELAVYLKSNPVVKLKVTGHTDDTGLPKYNLDLSSKRAREVTNYLVNAGIEKRRLSSKGMGDTVPLFPNDTEEHKAQNRRVEVVFGVD